MTLRLHLSPSVPLAMRLAAPMLAALMLAAAPARADVTVFAAASLRDALDAAATAYSDETDVAIHPAYAGTAALARQIQAGAPADIFWSASTDWLDALEASGLIAAASRVTLLTNQLVLIRPSTGAGAALGPLSASSDLGAFLRPGDRLAMALVDAVPAGQYGKAALQSLGQWQALEPFVAQTDNVRSALALVATGAAALGIVYATDARADPRVTVLGTFPASSHLPIVYPAALTATAGPEAQAFLTWLSGDAARAIFVAQGFGVPE